MTFLDVKQQKLIALAELCWRSYGNLISYDDEDFYNFKEGVKSGVIVIDEAALKQRMENFLASLQDKIHPECRERFLEYGQIFYEYQKLPLNQDLLAKVEGCDKCLVCTLDLMCGGVFRKHDLIESTPFRCYHVFQCRNCNHRHEYDSSG